MRKFGLLGKNISYSISPELHKSIMKEAGLSGEYNLLDVEEEEITEVISKIRSGKLAGINVTIPYKIKIMKFLDEISPEASAIGAVNCIVYSEGKLIGYNTDYYGILESFKKMRLDLKKKKVYVLGTGGAAKSAVKALQDSDADIIMVTRNIERDSLVFPELKMITYDRIERTQPKGYFIINCTPLGGMSSLESSPVSQKVVKNFEYVMDMVYKPPVTKFLSFAEEKKNSLNGMAMLIAQAVKAEELWNNIKINYRGDLK